MVFTEYTPAFNAGFPAHHSPLSCSPISTSLGLVILLPLPSTHKHSNSPPQSNTTITIAANINPRTKDNPHQTKACASDSTPSSSAAATPSAPHPGGSKCAERCSWADRSAAGRTRSRKSCATSFAPSAGGRTMRGARDRMRS